MKKAEQIRANNLKDKTMHKPEETKRNPLLENRRKTELRPPSMVQQVYKSKAERLKRYAEQMELEKHKNYEDGTGIYKDNLTRTLRGLLHTIMRIDRVPPVIMPGKLFSEADESEDELYLMFSKAVDSRHMPLRKVPLSNQYFKTNDKKEQGPFDLYSVFEYTQRSEKSKPITIRPVPDVERRSYQK